MTSFATWLRVVAFMALFAPAASSLAQPTPEEDLGDLESLLEERVVTTASRGAERASTAPSTVFTITAREMQIYGIRTVDEALNYLGIGMYSMRPRDYTTGIDVGAMGLVQRDNGRHILVMLDGHVMNSQDTGTVSIHEGLGVPLEAIDHLEVMLGAGSVMYGSNAMIAVINVVTGRPEHPGTIVHTVAELGLAPPVNVDGEPELPDDPGERFGLRYRFGAGVSSAFEALGSPAELTLRAEWLEEVSNTYDVPFLTSPNFQLRPGDTTWGGAVKHKSQAPSVFTRIRMGDFELRFQANYYERTMPLVSILNDPRSREERDAERIDLRHTATLTPETTLTSRLYADRTFFSEGSPWTSPYWCLEGQIDGCTFEMSSVGRSVGLEQVLTIDWNLDSVFVSTIGYDVRLRNTTARPADFADLVTGALPVTLQTPFIDETTVLGAIFGQQVYRPSDWLTLNVGARLDMDSQFGARVSPRVAAVLTPYEGTSLRASYSEAFRAPTSYELFERDPTYRIAALDLRPEVVHLGELEWQQRIDWVTVALRGYVAFYDDFIDSRSATQSEFDDAFARGEVASTADPEQMIRYDNLQDLRSIGGSFNVLLRPADRLTIAGSIAVADTRHDGERIALTPAWLGNARVSYQLAPDGATLSLAALFAGPRISFNDVLATETHEVDEALDLRATLEAPLPWVKGFRLRTTVAYTFNPSLPYLLTAPNEEEPDSPVVFYPVPSTLFAFVGVQYDFDL